MPIASLPQPLLCSAELLQAPFLASTFPSRFQDLLPEKAIGTSQVFSGPWQLLQQLRLLQECMTLAVARLQKPLQLPMIAMTVTLGMNPKKILTQMSVEKLILHMWIYKRLFHHMQLQQNAHPQRRLLESPCRQ